MIQASFLEDHGISRLTGDDRKLAARVIGQRHYTRCVPSGKSYYFSFEGALIVFSIPANRFAPNAVLGRPGSVWELTRLWAEDGHDANLLTRAISAAVKAFLVNEKCDAIVSYADPNAGHHGGVYQAASWVYQGQSTENRVYVDSAGHHHARRKFHSGNRHMNKAEIEAIGYREIKLPGKHRYAKAISKPARRDVARQSKPYPKMALLANQNGG